MCYFHGSKDQFTEWHWQCECCRRKYFFTSQMQFLMSNFWTIWLVQPEIIHTTYPYVVWIISGSTLTNAAEVTLELNLSQLRCNPDAHDTMLAPTSYWEPTFISKVTLGLLCILLLFFCYLGSHKRKGTALTLFTVALRTAQFFITHWMCYEIRGDHVTNSPIATIYLDHLLDDWCCYEHPITSQLIVGLTSHESPADKYNNCTDLFCYFIAHLFPFLFF